MAGAPPGGPGHGKGRNGRHQVADTRGGATTCGQGGHDRHNEEQRATPGPKASRLALLGMDESRTFSHASDRNLLEPAQDGKALGVTDEISLA